MNLLLQSGIITFSLILGLPSIVQSSEQLVEIKLVDDIDESRGYCLDIAGGRGANAAVDRGLQAHTCYDYTGALLEDQSFSAAMVEQGQFKIPYFDVCMSVSPIAEGSSIALSPCESVDSQQFSLEANGNLVVRANTDLCVTTSGSEKREGRGGTPVHVMRPLSLQPCSEDEKAYQVWQIFKL